MKQFFSKKINQVSNISNLFIWVIAFAVLLLGIGAITLGVKG